MNIHKINHALLLFFFAICFAIGVQKSFKKLKKAKGFLVWLKKIDIIEGDYAL
jgi:hypothetical protein